jgi:N-methylhydantoinase A
LHETFAALEAQARELLQVQGARDETIAFARGYDARYRGQSFELDVDHARSTRAIAERFHETHQRRYGYAVPDEPVELVNARLTATAPTVVRQAHHDEEQTRHPERVEGRGVVRQAHHDERRDVFINGSFVETPVYAREALSAQAMIAGPAIIEQYDSCTYVPPGWAARKHGATLLVERS